MRNDLVEIAIVMDESGSMMPLKDETISSINSFLDEQRKLPGYANFSFTMFNSSVDIQKRSIPIKNIHNLTVRDYNPGGYTALYDAIGDTVDDLGRRLNARPEHDRPAKVMVVIMTDGKENHSTRYNHERVHQVIKHQTDVYNWEFMFLGANIDAHVVAESIGIPAAMAANFDATPVGVSQAYNTINSRTTLNRMANH